MPKSRHRKDHKKKAKARKERLLNEKRKNLKMQREMLEKIMIEAQNGKFENTESIPDNDDNIELEL